MASIWLHNLIVMLCSRGVLVTATAQVERESEEERDGKVESVMGLHSDMETKMRMSLVRVRF